MADASSPRSNDDDEPVAQTTFHVRRAIGGDVDSLGWVVERLASVLLAHASYRLGEVLKPHCDPEDLVHDAWLVALPRLGELPARDGRHTPVLLKFLSTTVLNRVRNLTRKQVQGGVDLRRAGDPIGTGDPLADVPAAQSGVVSRAIRREVRDEVRTVLDGLEPADREVVLLRGIEQQSTATVGMLLEISADAVTQRYRRALKKLRARLPGSVFDEMDEG